MLNTQNNNENEEGEGEFVVFYHYQNIYGICLERKSETLQKYKKVR